MFAKKDFLFPCMRCSLVNARHQTSSRANAHCASGDWTHSFIICAAYDSFQPCCPRKTRRSAQGNSLASSLQSHQPIFVSLLGQVTSIFYLLYSMLLPPHLMISHAPERTFNNTTGWCCVFQFGGFNLHPRMFCAVLRARNLIF